MRKHDWADELARTIAHDLNVFPDKRRFDLIAARLRVVREEGVGEGLDQARKVIAPPSLTVKRDGVEIAKLNPGEKKDFQS
jgi:hypothetical protein